MDRDPRQQFLCITCMDELQVAHVFKIKCQNLVANRSKKTSNQSTQFRSTLKDAQLQKSSKNSHAVKIKDLSVRKINIQKKKPVKLGVPDVVECKICHKVFLNKQGLASHLIFKHGCRLNYQPKLKCGKSFIS